MSLKKKTCNGCRFVHVRTTGSRSNLDFQRICRLGVKNPERGYAKRIDGHRNIGCEHHSP